MKAHLDAPSACEDIADRDDPVASSAGTLLGWYTTEGGRRYIRAITTADGAVCLIDEADDGAFLIEPRLEDMAEVRALASDYLAVASERGEPQSRHPWPTTDGALQGRQR
jgi:hypothetical protein